MFNFILALSGIEVAIIVGIVVLFFGAKKIPELMRGVGSGVNEFKKGLKGNEEDKKEK